MRSCTTIWFDYFAMKWWFSVCVLYVIIIIMLNTMIKQRDVNICVYRESVSLSELHSFKMVYFLFFQFFFSSFSFFEYTNTFIFYDCSQKNSHFMCVFVYDVYASEWRSLSKSFLHYVDSTKSLLSASIIQYCVELPLNHAYTT